jgi:hypothetical protein
MSRQSRRPPRREGQLVWDHTWRQVQGDPSYTPSPAPLRELSEELTAQRRQRPKGPMEGSDDEHP